MMAMRVIRLLYYLPMERMKPFKWKSIEEIWIMVFWESCKLSKEEKESILEMFKIDQDITERQIIMENNINQARDFAYRLQRMRDNFELMRMLNYS